MSALIILWSQVQVLVGPPKKQTLISDGEGFVFCVLGLITQIPSQRARRSSLCDVFTFRLNVDAINTKIATMKNKSNQLKGAKNG
jgi:hypothetical protein